MADNEKKVAETAQASVAEKKTDAPAPKAEKKPKKDKVKFTDRVKKFWRDYKSEFKKVSWLSWKDTKKSSWIVLGVLVACAIVICLLDLGLFEGFMAMINAFGKLFAA